MTAFRYIISNAFKLIRRQWVLSLLTLITAAAMFWLLGVVSLASLNVRYMIDRIESDLLVQAYLKEGANVVQAQEYIKSLKGVIEVIAVSPDEALSRLEKRLGRQAEAVKLIGKNPLPWNFEVHLRDISDVEPTVKELTAMNDVSDVVYAGRFLERLSRMSSAVFMCVLGMFALTLLITSIVIYNTIRLSLYSQRDEIATMALVGATRGFVAYPFVILGTLLALAGSMLATVGLIFLYRGGIHVMQQALPFLPLLTDGPTLGKFYLTLAATGGVIGWLCSSISVSRYISLATKPL